VKQRYRRRNETEFVNSDFAQALYGNESENCSSHRHAERKAQQFCRQVQEALNLALAESGSDESLASLYVEEVSPAPDCGRLLVHVVVPTGCAIGEVIATLHRNAPRLRSEVAMAITRKRAPELVFVPAFGEGGSNE